MATPNQHIHSEKERKKERKEKKDRLDTKT